MDSGASVFEAFQGLSSAQETTCKGILTVNLYFPPDMDPDGLGPRK